MKIFFYVTFDFLHFILVAGISFSLRVAGAENKANLDIYIHCGHLSLQLDPNSGGAKIFSLEVYICPWWINGLKHQRIYTSLAFKGLR